MSLTLEEGKLAVHLARKTLEAHVGGTPIERRNHEPGILSEKRGVFVTLNKQLGGIKTLRGCIGYPEPVRPLGEAIEEVTVYATEDPRFLHTVSSAELKEIVVEVSVLTQPTDLKVDRREDLPSKVRLGVDGLIITNGYNSGLFLPQVATEQGWDQETYVSEACGKAGLPFDAWLDEATEVQVFQAEIFAELEPGGRVAKVNPESAR